MRLSPTAGAWALAFLLAFTILFTRILVQQRESAKVLNDFAFHLISLTTLGLRRPCRWGPPSKVPGTRVGLVRGGVNGGAAAIRGRVGPGSA